MRLAAAILVLAVASPARADDDVKKEGERRHGALVREGYNVTRGFHFGAADKEPVRVEMIVPEAGEHTVSLWLAAAGGEGAMRLSAADGRPVVAIAGRQAEATVTGDLAAGAYVLEIERARTGGGEALLGLRGGFVVSCDLDKARVTDVAAAPASGFSWPYLLFVPAEVRSKSLLVVPNNTGFLSEDVALLRAAGTCSVRGESALATRLGAVMLVPLFPRPAAAGDQDNLYLHALTRASLETKAAPATTRVDLQLLAMVKDARARLAKQGVDAGGKLLLTGFSASGSFVNRFAVLHPGEVLAVASGSPGGWPLAPVAEVGGDELPYPVGIADVAALVGQPVDLQALKAVRFYFFLGDKDENDAVPHRDSFSKTDEELVFRRFGPRPVARWKKAEKLYAGLDARFVLYPGVAHEVTPKMRADIERFFLDAQGPR